MKKYILVGLIAGVFIVSNAFAEKKPIHNGGHHHKPYPIHHGDNPWPRWNHPVFNRPVYDFKWLNLVSITCTAGDSQGDLFPVTENEYAGFGYKNRIAEIEDAALDRCHLESGGDEQCALVSCEPNY